MRRLGFGLSIAALAVAACDHPAPLAVEPNASASSATRPAITADFAEELFIDRAALPSHAGPGPHPTMESDRFRLIQGGFAWSSGDPVEYQVTGSEPVTGANQAVEHAIATWDGFVATRAFSRDDGSTQLNPCSGGPNTVQWASIDGPGSVLATAAVCRNLVTREIVGFVVTIDTDDTWSIGSVPGAFDVENVASHEFGHVAGLDHVNAPRDGCLTMYAFAAPGETQKRSLGLGDKLGMNALYASADVAAGSCNS